MDIKGSYFFDIGAFLKKLKNFNDTHFHIDVNGISIKSSDQLFSKFDDYFDVVIKNKFVFGDPISYRLYNVADASQFRFPLKSQIYGKKERVISILHVIPNSSFKKGIDLSFMSGLLTDNFIVRPFAERQNVFISNLNAHENYLDIYDTLIFGGFDGRNCYDDFDDNIIDIIKEWHTQKGIIIFCHDFICEKRKERFHYFTSMLDYKGDKKTTTFNNIVVRNNTCRSILNEPYTVSPFIKLGNTHESAQYGTQFLVLGDSQNDNVHYYSENLVNRIADCSIGHTYKINENERLLFFNIIYHLTKCSILLRNTKGSPQTNQNENTTSQNQQQSNKSSQNDQNGDNSHQSQSDSRNATHNQPNQNGLFYTQLDLNNSSNTKPEIVDLTPDQESDSLDDIDKQNEQSNAPI